MLEMDDAFLIGKYRQLTGGTKQIVENQSFLNKYEQILEIDSGKKLIPHFNMILRLGCVCYVHKEDVP